MWQLFAVSSLVATAFENVVDKWAIVSHRSLDASLSTFWRNGLFFLFTSCVGVLGWLGDVTWYFDWSILLFAMCTIASGFCYTYMLKKIEVTGIQAETYLMPLIFLAIDVVFLRAPLSAAEIAGIVLLAFGGFALAFDGKTRRIKREFSVIVWLIFIYWMAYDGFEYYLFKYLHTSQGMNSVSFFSSTYLVVTGCLLLIVIWRGQFKAIFGRGSARYLPAVVASKLLDTGGSLFLLTALTYAAVSQVSALGALQPLFLLTVAVFVQKETRFNIKERVDRANFRWKAFAVVLMCAGTILVS